MNTADCQPISILVLAGGRGQRMGGRDKGLVEWRGRPLVDWICSAARPLTDDLLISCNRNQARYARFADRLVSDDEEGFPGPLAGIRAGLAAARRRQLLVVPCDTPLIDTTLLVHMQQRARQAPDAPLMVRQNGQWEPLFCVIPTGLRETIDALWQQGVRSPRQALLAQGCIALDLAPDDPRLANLNSPELLRQVAPHEGT